jgi:hypothetical protein
MHRRCIDYWKSISPIRQHPKTGNGKSVGETVMVVSNWSTYLLDWLFFTSTLTEGHLESFKSHPQAIPLSRFLLEKPDQPAFVQWFCLSVHEALLPQWQRTLADPVKAETRRFLWAFLTSTYNILPAFVLNKLLKLIVDIARYEYPLRWPTFFQEVFALGNNHTTLSLLLLKTVSEEFVAPRNDLRLSRRMELKHQFTEEVPQIIKFMLSVLSDLYTKSCMQNGRSSFSPAKGSLDWQPSISENLSPTNLLADGVGELSEADLATCTHCLNTLLLLFAWIPLSDRFYIRAATEIILKYCQFNSDSNVAVGTLAISCLNEIISRKYVPAEFVSYLLLMVQHICTLLQQLVSKPSAELDEE